MPFNVGNQSDLQSQQALQQLLRGLNQMQAQQGLTSNGVPVPPPNMMMLQPQATYRPMHPSEFSSQLRVQFAQHQQLHTMPLPMPIGSMTPVARSGMFMPNLPPPMFGPGGMAHQHAIQNMNMQMAAMQSAGGVGARAFGSMAAGIGGGMLMPGLGSMWGQHAYESSGMGQQFQMAGSALFNPVIQQRAQALQLQRMSMGFVHGGSDLGVGGMGLSMTSASRLNSGLAQMAGSRQFQHDTGGMFNRQDVMRITNLAGQFGMLDQSQTADQIKMQVGRIARSLSGFMRIAEQPDVQEAMRMMGQMRSLGMTMPETSQAARNARMFARMAGVDTQTVLQQGMQGAGAFQAAGLSGASGMSAGMAATGLASSLASVMGTRQLAMAGGATGIAQTMVGGAAQAGITDPILAALLTRRGGHLAIDREALSRLTQGHMSIQDIAQQGASRIQALGGRSALMELSTRRRELQDQAQGIMGGTVSTLMPLILARSIQRGTPGMSMGGALRTLGMGEEQARTYEQMAQSPEFMANLQRQSRMEMSEQRREIERTRQETRDQASQLPMQRQLRRGMDSWGSRFDNFTANVDAEFSFAQDMDEAVEGAGGRVIRADGGRDFSTDGGRRALRRRGRARGGVDAFYRRLATLRPAVDRRIDIENAAGSVQDSRLGGAMQLATGGLAFAGAREIMGPTGLRIPGLSGPGGEYLRETVNANEDLTTRAFRGTGLAALLGQTPTDAQVEQRAREMERTGQLFEEGSRQSTRQRREATRAVQSSVQRGFGGGADTGRAQAAIASASAAVNRMLESRVTHLGPFGMTTSRPDEGEIQNTIRQSLIDSGMSVAEATRLSSDRATMSQVIDLGSGSRSPEARATADAIVAAGGEVGSARAGRTASAMREHARDRSSAVLERMGVSTGIFSRTSREGQQAVMNIMASEGEGAEGARILLNIRALEASGDTERAALLQQQFNNLSDAEQEAARDAVSGATASLSDADLRGIAGSYRGMSTEQITALSRRQHADAMDAQTEAVGASMVETMGQEAYDAAQRGPDALVELAQGGGRLGGASDEEQDTIRRGGRAGRQAARAYQRRMFNQATGDTTGVHVASSTGAAQTDDSGALSAILGDLGLGADADLGATGTETGEGGTGSEQFVHAIGVFNRASENLLAASENFQQASELGNLATAAAGSDGPGLLAGLVFPPLLFTR